MKLALLTTLILTLFALPAATKTKYNFISLLSSAQETPVCNQTGGLGNAIATYNTITMKFCYALSYIGLSQPVEMFSHIHAPGAINATAPVIFTLPTSPNKKECIMVNATQAESLLAELWYFNVHTTACGSGELRGQIWKI